MDTKSFEAVIRGLGLEPVSHVLKTRPRAFHWHIRKPGQRGTLEVTLEDGDWTLETRSNRQGDWIPEVAGLLAKELGIE